MQTDIEETSKRNSAVSLLPSMALAIFAAAGLTFGAAQVIGSFAMDAGISVNAKPLTWWTSSRFRFDHLDGKAAPLIADAVIKEFPPLVLPKISHKHRHHHLARTTLQANKSASVVLEVPVVVAAPTVTDQLPVVQSAAQPANLEVNNMPSDMERQKLQSIYQGFRAAFVSAVNTQERPVTTHVVQRVEPVPVAIVSPEPEKLTSLVKPVLKQHKVAKATEPKLQNSDVASAPKERVEPLAKVSILSLVTTQVQNVKLEPVVATLVSQNEVMGPALPSHVAAAPIAKHSEMDYFDEAKPAAFGPPIPADYSNGISIAAASPQTLMSTQVPAVPMTTQTDYPHPSIQLPSNIKTLSKVKYVEAFDWITTVSVTHSSIFSYEGSSSGLQGRWVNFSSPDHWPTLAWRYGSDSREAVTLVPLVSHNSSLILSKLINVTIQPETGIVFGKIPAGSTVEFAGRSERAVYFDQNNNVLPPDNTGTERYFALINAAPGAHLLKSISVPDGPRGAILVPVLEGTATYADLTPRHLNTISGKVVDGASSALMGLKGIEVRVIGQPQATVMTDAAGNFQLQQVMGVADRPLYLETDGRTGYTHRYRVTPSSFYGVTLFRLRPEQIQNWVGQLEGGISPDSGLAMGALPGLVNANPGQQLFPQFQSVLTSSNLPPETYTLVSDEDHLVTNTPLDSLSPRFVGVQLADGPILGKVEDKSQNVIWSELLIASPDVLNLIAE